MVDDSEQDLMKCVNLGSALSNLAEVFLHGSLGKFQLLVLMLHLLKLILERLDLSLSEVKLALTLLNVSDHVGLRLVSSLQQSLVQFDVGVKVFHLCLELRNLFLSMLELTLLVLEPVGQEKRLLNSSFGSGRSTRDGLNQSVANCICAVGLRASIAGHVHNGLVELLLD